MTLKVVSILIDSDWQGLGALSTAMHSLASALHCSCSPEELQSPQSMAPGREIQADSETSSAENQEKKQAQAVVPSISESSLDPLPSGHLPQVPSDTGSRASLVGEEEGAVSPEVNSSTSQSEDPSPQLVSSASPYSYGSEGIWKQILWECLLY